MAEAVYLLCALTSLLCAALLFRSYRRSQLQLILWTSLCFMGFALNNILLFADFVIVPNTDLNFWRHVTALGGVMILLYGLISSDLA